MDGVSHDRLHKHIAKNMNWKGILVEPLPDMMHKLRLNYSDRSDFIFEEVAITDEEGTADITHIPTGFVGTECPEWADGLSTLKPDIHIIGKDDALKPFSIKQPVQTTRFRTLADKHALDRIDILQIDAEGYDKNIFDQVWAANFRPNIVKVEINYLTYVEIKDFKNMLEAHNYQCFFERDDLVAARL